jgi:hypothetical protein
MLNRDESNEGGRSNAKAVIVTAALKRLGYGRSAITCVETTASQTRVNAAKAHAA